MKMNRELIRAVARKLRKLRHEAHYNQAETVAKTGCGTVACVGGWAALEAGATAQFSEAGNLIGLIYKGRPVQGVLGFARRRMGISEWMAEWLFSGGPISEWPAEYSDRLRNEERPSRVAADLLDAIADGKVKSSDGNPD